MHQTRRQAVLFFARNRFGHDAPWPVRCGKSRPGVHIVGSGPGDAVQENSMTDEAEKRGRLIRHLEEALALADEMEDGQTGFLIERAIDEARSRQFRPMG
jgi:hypothetical protein